MPWPLAEVAPLSEHPGALDAVARWAYGEWFERLGFSWEESLGFMRRRLNRDRLPLALVAMAGGAPVGTGSLLELPHPVTGAATCCLAGLYVVPHWRRRGLGSLICARAVENAQAVGAGSVGLFTGDGERFYARLGWRKSASGIPPRAGHGAPVAFMERFVGCRWRPVRTGLGPRVAHD
jgi:predicted N-acetyltransferase YhbS